MPLQLLRGEGRGDAPGEALGEAAGVVMAEGRLEL